MKRLILAAVAIVAIGITANAAQAGGPHGGWSGYHHHAQPYRGYYRPPVYRAPAYCAPYVAAPPVVYQPYPYYTPQSSFYYQGRNFGLQFGW